jgi:hypothetical protein
MHSTEFTRAAGAVVAGLALSAATSLAAAGAPAPAPKFGSPTGRVVYKVSGPMMNGTSTLTWADSGARFRSDTSGTISMGQQPMQMNTWTINDGKNLYVFQPMMGKQVMRMKMTKAQIQRLTGSTLGLGAAKAGKKIGKETVLGKSCDVYDLKQAKVWMYNGLPLRSETMAGPAAGTKSIATKLELGARVAPTAFKIPAGYTVKDFDPSAMRRGGGPPPAMPARPR